MKSLQSGIVTTSNVFDSAIASVSNNAALQIKQTSNAAISAIYTTKPGIEQHNHGNVEFACGKPKGSK